MLDYSLFRPYSPLLHCRHLEKKMGQKVNIFSRFTYGLILRIMFTNVTRCTFFPGSGEGWGMDCSIHVGIMSQVEVSFGILYWFYNVSLLSFGWHRSPLRSDFVSQSVSQSGSHQFFTMFPLEDLYETHTVYVSWLYLVTCKRSRS